MKSVNTVEFKSKLSHYISEVREGEPLYVTSHGHPVVEVRGIGSDAPFGIRTPDRPVSDLSLIQVSPRQGLRAGEILTLDRGRR
ncbi:MAG: type II toxin-antitoxin system prevent-host-death family antitoxin [Verrucomicrobia bacterium]|nr:type II toxin-antitoxin system prevent-host-death family antitoxin [Verrucomicrobiota bacterium]MCH8528433.1 type II toxin-antitoxin system prevent-host-death family antitoxin [Kiritimatiellia bacterium]